MTFRAPMQAMRFGSIALLLAISYSVQPAAAQYNVTLFDTALASAWLNPGDVLAMGFAQPVHQSDDFWAFSKNSPYLWPEIQRNGIHYHWGMWATLAWANNTIYTPTTGNKAPITYGQTPAGSYTDIGDAVANIVWAPTDFRWANFRWYSTSMHFTPWIPLAEHSAMASRNTYGTGTPCLFAVGIESIFRYVLLPLTSSTGSALLVDFSAFPVEVEQSGPTGNFPFAVNRRQQVNAVADANLILVTEVLDYPASIFHFCRAIFSREVRVRLLAEVDRYNQANPAAQLNIQTTYSGLVINRVTIEILIGQLVYYYRFFTYQAIMYLDCWVGLFTYYFQFYAFTWANPGVIVFICDNTFQGWFIYDASDLDDLFVFFNHDVYATFFQDYSVRFETSYTTFCEWYTPQATVTTLPWSVDFLNNTYPEIFWKKFLAGNQGTYQQALYRNGFCNGQESPEWFGDPVEQYYPANGVFDRISEEVYCWTSIMDGMFYLLWGHQLATQSAGFSYTLSDWWSGLDSASGFGFLSNFNPGNQSRFNARVQFKSAFRTQCVIFWSSSNRVSNHHIAFIEVAPSGSYVVLSSETAPQPSFCMDSMPAKAFLNCDEGSYYDMFWGLCLTCKPGSAQGDKGQTVCGTCTEGSYAAAEGAKLCDLCEAGRAIAITSATECDVCEIGYYAEKSGSQECRVCEAGSYTATKETVLCKDCDLATFQDTTGKSSCIACNATRTTLGKRTTTQEDCLCKAGHYNRETWTSSPEDAIPCLTCASMMPDNENIYACRGREKAARIMLKPGYMSLPGSSKIYKCEGKGAACPSERALGEFACPNEATGISCAMCVKDYKWDAVESKCVECDEASVAMLVIAGLFASAIIFRIRPKAPTFVAKQLLDMIAFTNISVPVSQLIDFIQFGMVLGMASIEWPASIRKFLKRLGSILDINMYSLECKMGGDHRDNYPFAYIMLLNSLPVMFIVAVAILCLPSAVSRKMQAMRFPSPILGVNLVLSVTSALFMTIFNFAVSLGFQTFEHPALVGMEKPESSLVAFPYLLVGSNKVSGMRMFCAVCICVWSLCFIVMPLIVIWVSPNKRSQTKFRRCTLSLLIKFRDETSWWTSLDLFTKVNVVLAVNVFHDPAWQYRWLAGTVVTYTCAVLLVWPYRLAKHNLGECATSLCKIAILACGLTVFEPEAESNDALYFICFFFAVFCVGIEFIFCLLDFCRSRTEAYPNDIQQLQALRSVFKTLAPTDYSCNDNALTKLRELMYSSSKVPRNKQQLANSMHSTGQAETLESKNIQEKEDLGKLSLKIKQSEVLWTIALHYQTNDPSLHARCGEIKEIQTNLYNSLRSALANNDESTLELSLITENLTKHEEKINELKVLLEQSPVESKAIADDVENKAIADDV